MRRLIAAVVLATAGPVLADTAGPAFGPDARGHLRLLDDFTGDTRVEPVLDARGALSVLERDDADTWVVRPLGGDAGPVATGDFDGDGLPELAVATPAALVVHARSAQGEWSARRLSYRGPAPMRVNDAVSADLDGDGRPELFLAGEPASGWWRVEADGLVPLPEQAQAAAAVRAAALADLDADGRRELVLLDAGGAVRIAGAARDAPPLATGVRAVALGDADDDGDADLLVVAEGWRLLRNDRASGFRESAGGPGMAATLVDYDNDGRQDVVALGDDATVRLWRQQRRLRFAAPLELGRVPAGSDRLAAADLDRDGFTDLVVSGPDAPHVLPNRGADQRWLGFDLRGQTADAGRAAMVEIIRRDGGRRLRATFGAASTVIGLGRMAQVDVIAVYWPSGRVTRLQADRFDRYVEVREPGSDPKGRRAVGVPQRHYRDHPFECR